MKWDGDNFAPRPMKRPNHSYASASAASRRENETAHGLGVVNLVREITVNAARVFKALGPGES